MTDPTGRERPTKFTRRLRVPTPSHTSADARFPSGAAGMDTFGRLNR